jgi:hypothetical protein
LIAISAFGLVRSQAENADLQVGDLGAQCDDDAHILMAENVPGLHRRLIAIEQMKIGTADRARRYLDDRVARMLDLWVRDSIDPNIAFSMPNQCAHLKVSVL